MVDCYANIVTALVQLLAHLPSSSSRCTCAKKRKFILEFRQNLPNLVNHFWNLTVSQNTRSLRLPPVCLVVLVLRCVLMYWNRLTPLVIAFFRYIMVCFFLFSVFFFRFMFFSGHLFWLELYPILPIPFLYTTPLMYIGTQTCAGNLFKFCYRASTD